MNSPRVVPPPSAAVAAYLDALPDDRRVALTAVREAIVANLDPDYEEGIQYGMIGYYVPHRVFPAGYHCDPKEPLPFAGLASKKAHMSLHLMAVYADADLAQWFSEAWKEGGRKLDMGASCVRFKKLGDVPLALVGEAIARVPAKDYIARYEKNLAAQRALAKKPRGPK